MKKRDDTLFFEDILTHAQMAVSFCTGFDLDAFTKDEKTLKAVERCLEIIGEAATRLSTDAKNTIPGVPWAKIRGMRNVVAHQYWGISPKII